MKSLEDAPKPKSKEDKDISVSIKPHKTIIRKHKLVTEGINKEMKIIENKIPYEYKGYKVDNGSDGFLSVYDSKGKEVEKRVFTSKENANKFIDELVEESFEDHNQVDILGLVENHFSTLDTPPRGRTFIMPNGKFLNLSKCKHHSDVELWLNQQGLSDALAIPSGGSPTLSFLGCVRCDTDKNSIVLPACADITDEIGNSLLLWLDQLSRVEDNVQVTGHDGQWIKYDFKEYISDDIVDRINYYYHRGELREDLNKMKRACNFKYERNPAGSPLKIDHNSVDKELLNKKKEEFKQLKEAMKKENKIYIEGPRGRFLLSDKTIDELRDEGYGYHHTFWGEDGKGYDVVVNKFNKAVAVLKENLGDSSTTIKVKSFQDIIKYVEDNDVIDLIKSKYGLEINSEDGYELNVWIATSTRWNGWPVLQLDDPDVNIIHKEGPENPELWQKWVLRELNRAKINKNINEDLGLEEAYTPGAYDSEHNHNMLGRLVSDVKYYLDAGNRDPKFLYFKDEKEQIRYIKMIYNWLKDHNDIPGDITIGDINMLEKELLEENFIPDDEPDYKDPEEFNAKHAAEWMDKHPYGWYNNEWDKGTGDENLNEDYSYYPHNVKYFDQYRIKDDMDIYESNEFFAGMRDELDEVNDNYSYISLILDRDKDDIVYLYPQFVGSDNVEIGYERFDPETVLLDSFVSDYGDSTEEFHKDYESKIKLIRDEIKRINLDMKKVANSWGFRKNQSKLREDLKIDIEIPNEIKEALLKYLKDFSFKVTDRDTNEDLDFQFYSNGIKKIEKVDFLPDEEYSEGDEKYLITGDAYAETTVFGDQRDVDDWDEKDITIDIDDVQVPLYVWKDKQGNIKVEDFDFELDDSIEVPTGEDLNPGPDEDI